MARESTATAAPRYVPNPRYEAAPYEITFTDVAGRKYPLPRPCRYYYREAALRHLYTGVEQPESVPPMVKEGE